MRKRFDRSLALLTRASRIIPGGSQTFSKGPTQFSVGASPLFLDRGEGCHVWDVDDHEYIDVAMGLGTNILGYSHPEVIQAATEQAKKGSGFSLPTALEAELAEQLIDLIPSAEMVRFAKNGSDVTSAAIRLARAATGRDRIACCGYHGWHDWYIATTSRANGVPKTVGRLTDTFDFNDLLSLEKLLNQYPNEFAAIILEPTGPTEPKKGFLEDVQTLSRKNGAVLIFDEIISGFRWHLGGAQAAYGVTPDLSCFGKAMGNGFSTSAIVGRRELMSLFEEVFFSGTQGGEAVSLAAAIKTIEILGRDQVPGQLHEIGSYATEKMASIVRGPLSVQGSGPRSLIQLEGSESDRIRLQTYLQQECVQRGLLYVGYHNWSQPHDRITVNRICEIYDEVFSDALNRPPADLPLKGELLSPVFRKIAP